MLDGLVLSLCLSLSVFLCLTFSLFGSVCVLHFKCCCVLNVCAVSLLRDLKHANIVTLHDIIHTDSCLTLVFEYLVCICGYLAFVSVWSVCILRAVNSLQCFTCTLPCVKFSRNALLLEY